MSFAIDILVTEPAWDRCVREVRREQRRLAGQVPVYPWEAPPGDPKGSWWLGPDARFEIRAGDAVLRLDGSARWLVEGLRPWLADRTRDRLIEGESVWQTPDLRFTVRGDVVELVVGLRPPVRLHGRLDEAADAVAATVAAFDAEFERRLQAAEEQAQA